MLLLLFFSSALWAQGMENLFAPPKSVVQASARSALENYQASGQFVIFKSDEQAFALGFRYGLLDARPIDKTLYTEDLIVSYSKNLEGQRRVGTRLLLGSQSDKPFAGSNVLAIFTSVYYTYPVSERAQWMLSVNYSNLSVMWNDLPFPGVNYFFKTSEWIILAGFPVNSATWISKNGYSLTAALMGIYSVRLEAAYGPPWMQFFANLEWGQVGYLLKERSNNRDRLFLDEKRASLGARVAASKQTRLDIRGGYAFDRSFFQAQSYKDKNASNTTEFKDSWFAGLSLTHEL